MTRGGGYEEARGSKARRKGPQLGKVHEEHNSEDGEYQAAKQMSGSLGRRKRRVQGRLRRRG
jgi:hypothetical protein